MFGDVMFRFSNGALLDARSAVAEIRIFLLAFLFYPAFCSRGRATPRGHAKTVEVDRSIPASAHVLLD